MAASCRALAGVLAAWDVVMSIIGEIYVNVKEYINSYKTSKVMAEVTCFRVPKYMNTT